MRVGKRHGPSRNNHLIRPFMRTMLFALFLFTLSSTRVETAYTPVKRFPVCNGDSCECAERFAVSGFYEQKRILDIL